VNTSSGLRGDASAKIAASGKAGGASGTFGQTLTGTSLQVNGYGYALGCTDGNYPPVSGGVTLECWFDCNTGAATGGLTGFGAATTGSLFTNNNATYANGDAVTLTAVAGFSLPGGFSANTVYYVISASGANFQLSATLGGTAITVTSAGSGLMGVTTAWSPSVFSARNLSGPVAEIDVRNTDGALLLRYKPASGTQTLVVLDAGHDYRNVGGMTYIGLAFTQTAWRAVVGAFGVAAYSGTFSSPLAAKFDELWFCGMQSRTAQGFAFSGYTALGAVYPLMLSNARMFAHYLVTAYGAGAGGTGGGGEAAWSRIERLIEYSGLAGRRWIGQETVTYETDQVTSGQDIGGQSAASSAGNIASSTLPAMLYVAPTGDIAYLPKQLAWNQPVKWVLGDNVTVVTESYLLAENAGFLLAEDGGLLLAEGSGTPAGGGEIPFTIGQFATDYDPARVVNDIQLTQLDTQAVTVPSGVMSATTVAALEAASEAQYGDQPYQQSGYLGWDGTSAYTAGAGLTDLAAWIACIYRKPANRIQAVTVEAAANAANVSQWLAWQFWAGAAVGDMVTVNVRLPTAATSPLISLTARITQTQRAVQYSQDGTSASITCVLDFAPEYRALICDDPVRGLLNGSNVLAWLCRRPRSRIPAPGQRTTW